MAIFTIKVDLGSVVLLSCHGSAISLCDQEDAFLSCSPAIQAGVCQNVVCTHINKVPVTGACVLIETRSISPQLSEEENKRIYGKCSHINGHGHNYIGMYVCVSTMLCVCNSV